jgi:antitoxin MazE
MKAKIVKWGNSLAVRIPKPAAERARLNEGDSLEIETAEGQIALHRISHVPSLSKLVAQITPENRYSEISTADEIGKEAVEW